MAGFTPKEGKNLFLSSFYRQEYGDRGPYLELGLYTNVQSITVDSTLSIITEPNSGPYLRKALSDGTWVVGSEQASYPTQVFTCAGPDFSAPVYGFFVATAGTTPRLMHVQPNSGGVSYQVNSGDSFTADLSNLID